MQDPYDDLADRIFPEIKASDRSIFGIHSWWGHGYWEGENRLLVGLKQVEPPYLYGYAVRIRTGKRVHFAGLCRERKNDKPLVRPLDTDVEEIIKWGSDDETEQKQDPETQPSTD